MQTTLEAEVERWSAMPIDELTSRLADLCNYQIERNGTIYQFEVEILEDKAEYLHVDVRVDDGGLPYSISPLGLGFTKQKHSS